MMRRSLIVSTLVGVMSIVAVAPAWACGGLVNPNGTVSLTRTTTLAGYKWGVEHYITSFEFAGGGAEFGSIVPLPGIPKKVTRAGDWTLQRLVREVSPPPPVASPDSANGGGADGEAEEIYETEIDSLKITILKGGGDAVGKWAKNNGFQLSPDSPEVLDYYAERSEIFMAARFDPKKARGSGKEEGDGVPIHLRIPTDEPWVPLRILGLGLGETAPISADVFLLTRREPALLPEPAAPGSGGVSLERSEAASKDLLRDLESDKGMGWVPLGNMWLSYLKIDTEAGDLKFDLATNVHGGSPSEEDAGIQGDEEANRSTDDSPYSFPWMAFALFGTGSLAVARRAFASKR